MTVDLERAKGGDERAFASLVEPFRRELQLHCYRLLGSVQDAEDLVQETLLAAWRGLNGFEERASLRSWLYRIATNRSLNAIRERGRRPATENTMRPSRTRRAVEPSWLEPYADSALPDPAPGPEARYEQREAIQLSFIVALQQLPAKQRAALVLRDVLGFHTDEAASILETTPQSVKAALQRARATLDSYTVERQQAPLPASSDPGCEYFKETGHNVCYQFRTTYRELGPVRMGFPLTEMESDARGVLGQDFEYARLEWLNGKVHRAPIGRDFLRTRSTAPASS